MIACKQLVLHVGLPKTGTTALQKWFRQHRPELALVGIDYPEHFGHQDDKHSFLVGELRNNPMIPTLKNIVSKSTCETILFSNEGLSNHFYDFHPDALQAFRDLSQDIEINIVFVTRPVDAWLKSYHKQCVLNPNNGSSDLWGTSLHIDEIKDHPRIKQLLDHNTLLADMKRNYGAQATHHIRFDDTNWFSSILEILGINHLRTHPLPNINDSLPDWAIEMMRQVNSYVASNQNRQVFKRLLQDFLSTNHTIMTETAQTILYDTFSNIDLAVLEHIVVSEGEDGKKVGKTKSLEFEKFTTFVRLIVEGAL